jgi:hypothetical protein
LLDQDAEAVRANLSCLSPEKLGQLADLHEQSGMRTPRNEPAEVNRHCHFRLTSFIRKHLGTLDEESMPAKLAVLEGRRLAMIDRRAEALAKKTAVMARDDPRSERLTAELNRLEKLQRPAALPGSGHRIPNPLTAGRGFAWAGILIALAVFGALSWLVKNSADYLTLKERIAATQILFQEQKHERAVTELVDLEALASRYWPLQDVRPQREDIAKLNLVAAGGYLRRAHNEIKLVEDAVRRRDHQTAGIISDSLEQVLNHAERTMGRAAASGKSDETLNESLRVLREGLRKHRTAMAGS